MWKKLLAWILVTVILTGYGIQIVEAFDQKENVRMEEVIEKPDQNSLYAKAAVLMDADSGRILYEKNGHQAMANASTTKILTCIIALENCDLDSEVTVSTLAASQPKVHKFCKITRRACNVFCNRHSAVIIRFQHQSVQQIFQIKLLPLPHTQMNFRL